jgi:diaminohydroxyphosphoribosylaminopyrimidine deaminase/5-amino-6-(5-phosphoribosylamino)uracil reductase
MNLFTGFKESRQASTAGSDTDAQSVDGYHLNPGDDERYMAQALQLARKGIYSTDPNPAVGCVIVNNGKIVGQGWHELAGQAHAEVIALKQAGSAATQATMYVTLEPCSHQGKTPPCVKSIVKSGVSRVVIATEDPNPLVNRSGISELQQAGIDITLGVGQIQAKKINRGFLKRVSTGIPWVSLKIASSLDGKTAMADGESQWITSEPARRDAQKYRAAASGILTGAGTVLRDNPSMNARLDGIQRQPTRIILDTNLSTPPDAKILHAPGKVLIVTAFREDEAIEGFQNDYVEVMQCPAVGGKIDLQPLMVELGKREMNTILLEAGSRLSGSMIEQGLVDEIIVYMAPDLLGSDARGMFDIPGLEKITDRVKLEYRDVTMVGRDIRLTLGILGKKQ